MLWHSKRLYLWKIISSYILIMKSKISHKLFLQFVKLKLEGEGILK